MAIYTRAPMHEEPYEPQPVLHPSLTPETGGTVEASAVAPEAGGSVDAIALAPEASGAVEASEPARKPRVIALLNQKGGVGKTTSTVNLGAAFARYGQRVLLVDLDPQSNLSLHFGVESGPEQRTIRDLLLDPTCRIEDAVQTARPGLDFIPAVTELALVEGELAQQEGMQTVLRSKLEPVYGNYDIVLLDCPPSLGVLSVNALTVADEVFVPMQAHYLPLRGLEKLLQTVHLISQGLNPTIRVTGILLCMHDGSSSHARAVIGEIESQLAQFRGMDVPWSTATVLDPPVRRNIKLAEAPSFGQTIFDYAPKCPGADDYRRIAEQLLIGWGLPHGSFDGAAVGGNGSGAAVPKKRKATKGTKRGAKSTKPTGSSKSARNSAKKSAKSAKAASKITKKASATKAAAKVATKSAKPVKRAQATIAKASKANASKAARAARAVKVAKAGRTITMAKLTKSARTTPKAKPTKSARTSKPARSAKASKPAKPAKIAKPTKRPARRSLRSGGLSL
ncbi:MAG: ParA family protein [Planctomycetota bacterium]|nr:MAG: ParA family protein [Planctomycetota bacterium]